MQIKENEPLSKYTTFHIGGPAKYFVIVKNAEELREALKWAEEKGEKYFILGGGSNLLFSDNGFSGLVIKIAFMSVEIDGEEVIAGAGAPLLLVAKKAAEAGLAGIENLAGIPGTIGGAVCDNAGAYGGEIADAVQKAEILTVGSSTSYQLEQVDKNWFEFEYRKSKLKEWSRLNLDHQKPVILRVWLKLKNVGVQNSEPLQNRIKEVMQDRREKEPKGFSAGCAFKNIKGGQVAEILEKFDFTPEERERFGSREAIPTAWFIEKAGLKGKKIGGAYIPKEHANYLINDGTATADNVLQLISLIKQQVRDKFGIQLEEEIQIIS